MLVDSDTKQPQASGPRASARPHYLGHRRRLRERVARSGLASLAEYEIIELLLTLALPRADVKPLAKVLLGQFGSLRGILDASVEDLAVVRGVGPAVSATFRLIREVASVYLQQQAEDHDCLHHEEALFAFWRSRIGGLPHEVFEVAYLDSGYRLLHDGVEQLERGINDRAAVYPRAVMEAALRRRAAAVVFAHNHPSGQVEPSEHDRALTRVLVSAAETLQIRVVDHLVVSASEVFSFRRAGLL